MICFLSKFLECILYTDDLTELVLRDIEISRKKFAWLNCGIDRIWMIALVKYILYQADCTMNGINLNEVFDHEISLGVSYSEH